MQRFSFNIRNGASWAAVAMAAMATAACGLAKQVEPPLMGPSGLGRQVLVTASPDQLPRDSSSQSVVTVEVRDATGKGVAGQIVSVGVTTGATVSQSQVTTGGDGKATFAVVAPSVQAIIPNNQLIVSAVPVGGDFNNAVQGTATIALLGVSNSTAPTAAFTVAPVAPELNQLATFDATTSKDEGANCGSQCTYAWNFDDGTTASGMIVTHSFSAVRSYSVSLTVTDSTGLTSTIRQLVSPTAPAAPTVVLSVSPATPVVGQQAVFKAVGTPAQNHSIVSYDWDFGDGTRVTTTTSSVTHTFNARGIYNVVVTVTDDVGQKGHATAQYDLSTGVPTGINAKFFQTGSLVHGNTTIFNANESTPSNGASITNYHWDFGDVIGNEEDDSTPITSHIFAAAGTYQVQLTITDSSGRTSIFRLAVTIT